MNRTLLLTVMFCLAVLAWIWHNIDHATRWPPDYVSQVMIMENGWVTEPGGWQDLYNSADLRAVFAVKAGGARNPSLVSPNFAAASRQTAERRVIWTIANDSIYWIYGGRLSDAGGEAISILRGHYEPFKDFSRITPDPGSGFHNAKLAEYASKRFRRHREYWLSVKNGPWNPTPNYKLEMYFENSNSMDTVQSIYLKPISPLTMRRWLGDRGEHHDGSPEEQCYVDLNFEKDGWLFLSAIVHKTLFLWKCKPQVSQEINKAGGLSWFTRGLWIPVLMRQIEDVTMYRLGLEGDQVWVVADDGRLFDLGNINDFEGEATPVPLEGDRIRILLRDADQIEPTFAITDRTIFPVTAPSKAKPFRLERKSAFTRIRHIENCVEQYLAARAAYLADHPPVDDDAAPDADPNPAAIAVPP